ncbi:hypothetical protein FHX47_000278 [Garicola koreensis]|uniref:Uncharacterized protein n=1 Tax=Garicola koreensis TaxID=1262554 RepID=A0A7W5TPG9_9MICC|nr:hypothetical protein [Garicola koreensis]
MLNWLLRLRRMRGDARAVRRGPQAMGKRAGRRGLHRLVRRLFR